MNSSLYLEWSFIYLFLFRNDYILKTNNLYSEQNHPRNSSSMFCLHLPGAVLQTRTYNKLHGFSPLGELSLAKRWLPCNLANATVMAWAMYSGSIHLEKFVTGFAEELTVEPGIERHGGVCQWVGGGQWERILGNMQSILHGRTWASENREVCRVAAIQGI